MECVVRPCRAEDCVEVMRMIRELAEFEKLPDQVQINDQVLREDGFANDPFYRCLVAEVPPEYRSRDGHTIVGYGLYFFTYSTWKGRNIYMEDLYIMPEFRELEREPRSPGSQPPCSNPPGPTLLLQSEREPRSPDTHPHPVDCSQIGVENRCIEMKFVVLDWNQAAIDFYQSQGAVDLTAAEGWHFFHFKGDALVRLAQGQTGL
ncbi:thialysine N-epsilon-acetyltransferase-like isoform X8 [Pelodiscus sinensis]|uniref:thialysine N-epsilon-acetyltransferase-like isoform X8 n=1 Tax=Pelodiscus sinensis TaxID=13735 RepID=UPI003F6BD3DF